MEEEKDKIRDRRKKSWFYLDNEYLNGYAKIFGAVGTAVYVSLCRHVDKNQKCFPSQKLISEELNIGERTVRNYLKKFEECNLISVERNTDKKTKKRINNTYWLLDKEVWRKPEATGAYGKKKPEANDDTIQRQMTTESQRQQVPIKETNEEKKTNIKNTHIAKTSFCGKDINDLIELFKPINPAYERLFKNKTQREALEGIVEKSGVEPVRRLLKALPGIVVKKFAPRISTPCQLRDKLGDLKIFLEQEKPRGKGIVFAPSTK